MVRVLELNIGGFLLTQIAFDDSCYNCVLYREKSKMLKLPVNNQQPVTYTGYMVHAFWIKLLPLDICIPLTVKSFAYNKTMDHVIDSLFSMW